MYNIFSGKKREIVNVFNSNTFNINSVLIIGREKTGKSILAFNIAKNYFNEKNLIDVFFNPNFLYLCKNDSNKEIQLLINSIKNYSDRLHSNYDQKENDINFLKIFVYKLIFQYYKILSQYFYNVSSVKKELKGKELEELSKSYYKLKDIYIEIFNNNSEIFKEHIDYLLLLSTEIRELFDNIKLEYIYIQEIFNIQKWINEKPFSEKKLIIIESVDKMTVEVENAFLKTLEEPKEGTKFLLTTTNKEKLLPTIISRCVKYNIDKIDEREIKEIITNEWGESYLSFLNLYIYDFKRFFDITVNEDKGRYINQKAEDFINELIINDVSISRFYKIIYDKTIFENLELFLDELIISLIKKINNEDINQKFTEININYFNLKNILNFIEKLKFLSKEVNFSIEDGLIFLVLNKEDIINGVIDGIKFIL